MPTFQKLRRQWKRLELKGRVFNLSSKTLWIVEGDHGKATAYLLLPGTCSDYEMDVDGFRRFDNEPVEGDEFSKKPINYNHEKKTGDSIKVIDNVRRNKKRRIIKYHVTGIGWISPEEALEMTCAGEICNARPVFPGYGAPYIRTRRDKEIFNNLEVKG